MTAGPTSEILIQLLWGGAPAKDIFKAPQAILKCVEFENYCLDCGVLKAMCVFPSTVLLQHRQGNACISLSE